MSEVVNVTSDLSEVTGDTGNRSLLMASWERSFSARHSVYIVEHLASPRMSKAGLVCRLTSVWGLEDSCMSWGLQHLCVSVTDPHT